MKLFACMQAYEDALHLAIRAPAHSPSLFPYLAQAARQARTLPAVFCTRKHDRCGCV